MTTPPYKIRTVLDKTSGWPFANAGSRVEVVMTTVDALAFSEALKAAFPRVMFASGSRRGKWREPDIRLCDSIPACEASEVNVLFAPENWEPEVYWLPADTSSKWVVVGCPSPKINILWRSKITEERCAGDPEPWFSLWTSDVNISYNRDVVEHVRKRDKIMRLTRKYASRKTRSILLPSRQPIPHGSAIWAGHDAIRWSLAEPRRVFNHRDSWGYEPIPPA